MSKSRLAFLIWLARGRFGSIGLVCGHVNSIYLLIRVSLCIIGSLGIEHVSGWVFLLSQITKPVFVFHLIVLCSFGPYSHLFYAHHAFLWHVRLKSCRMHLGIHLSPNRALKIVSSLPHLIPLCWRKVGRGFIAPTASLFSPFSRHSLPLASAALHLGPLPHRRSPLWPSFLLPFSSPSSSLSSLDEVCAFFPILFFFVHNHDVSM